MTATTSTPVRAGMIYRSPANSNGRCRYLRVEQVLVTGSYAICREVTKEGEPVHGRDRNGLKRGEPFRVGVNGGALVGYYAMEVRS